MRFAFALLAAVALCAAKGDGRDSFFAKALPVWSKDDSHKENCARVFEGEFAWTGECTNRFPVLRLAASYGCRVEVNGVFQGYGPARAPKGVFRVDEWPLTATRKGRNSLKIISLAHNIPTYQWMMQNAFVQCEVLNGDEVLLAGQEMRVSPLSIYVDSKRRYSFQRGWQERYRVGGGDAKSLGCSVVKPATPCRYVSRGVPYPKFTLHGNFRKVSHSGGVSLFDAGMNDAGFIVLDVHAKTTGVVRLTWDEMLSKGFVDTNRLHAASELLVEVSSPGDFTVETLEPYAGRWFETRCSDGIEAEVSLRTYKHPVADAPLRSSRNPKLMKAAVETFAQNAADCLTDCPSRERAGWLCDSFFEGRAEQFLTGSNAVERAFLENFALADGFEAIPEGMVPMCFPADHSRVKNPQRPRNFIPNWAMWFVLHADDYVQRTGDRRMAAMLRPRIDGVERYFRGFLNADGLLENLRGWVFVEWSKANKLTKGVNYPSNMLYAEMLDGIDRLYGRPDLKRQAAALRAAIREKSFDGRYFRDHDLGEEATETCQYYAFFTHTATCESHPELWKTLVDEFGPMRDARKVHPDIAKSNAFIGNFLRFELLYNAGLYEVLRAEAEAYFTKMANATGTLWEHSRPNASCCHGFASYIAVLLEAKQNSLSNKEEIK